MEIRLYDAIGYEMDAEWLAAQIPADAEHVTVRINSPGGAVSDGLAMYHYLKDHGATVTTIVDGYAASAASVVMLAGDVRQIHRASLVMVHNPWSMAVGNADEMRKAADTLDVHAEALLDVYTAETGMDREELRGLLAEETWMRGEAAVQFGFASEVIEAATENDNRAAACVHFAQMIAAIEGGKELVKDETQSEVIEEPVAEVEETAPEAAEDVEDLGEEVVVAEVEIDTDDEPEAEEQPEVHSVVDEPKPKTKREAVEQTEAAKGEIVSLEAEIVAIRTERENLVAQLAESHSEVEALKAQAEEMDAAMLVAVAERDEATANAEAAEAELDRARKALADPQYADAALVADDSEIVAEDAESVIEADEEGEPADIADEWERMPQGAERAEFWNKHKKSILRALAARG